MTTENEHNLGVARAAGLDARTAEASIAVVGGAPLGSEGTANPSPHDLGINNNNCLDYRN